MANDSRRLPGLDYTGNLGSDDYEFNEAVIAEEIRRRTQLMMGVFRAAGARYGIASEADPRTVASTGTDPLLVRQNATDKTRFDVLQGQAVTPAGDILFLTQDQLSIQPALSLTAGDQFVVYLEYRILDDADTTEPNVFNQSVPRRRIRPTDAELVQVATLAQYQDTSIFSSDRREHIVLLSHLTVALETDLTLRLDVSLDETKLADNRPWFSIVDQEHRSLRGSGSSSVAHSLSFNDLSGGSMTLYQQICRTGQIVARDLSYPAIPGTVCSEALAAPTTDTDGSVTGTVSTKYYRLQRFPTTLLGAVDSADPDRELAVALLPGTNLLVLSPSEYVSVYGMTVYYAACTAGEADPITITNNEVTFGQPVSGSELVISGGKVVSALTPTFTNAFGYQRSKISFGQAGPFPRRYQVWADSTGALMLAPQILMCAAPLARLGTADFPLTAVPAGDGKIILGLTGTPAVVTMNLTVRVSGADAVSGSQISEDLTFTYANYSPTPAVPTSTDVPGYYVSTAARFAASAVTLQVLTKTSININAMLMVLVDISATTSPQMRDVCPLAEITWDGQVVSRIRDLRRISTGLTAAPTRSSPSRLAAQAALAAMTYNGTTPQAFCIVADDFRAPQHASIALDAQTKQQRTTDGLRSTFLPVSPSDTSLHDVYYSQAVTLPDYATPAASNRSRQMQIVLLGEDADSFGPMPNQGIVPLVQYRIGQQGGSAWGSWTAPTRATIGNRMSWFAQLPDSYAANFKIQFRIKASAVGFVAFLRSMDAYPNLTTLVPDDNNFNTDASVGASFLLTLTINKMWLLAPTNLVQGQTYRWIVVQDGTGLRGLEFASIFLWTGGAAPDLTTDIAGRRALITATYDGTYLIAQCVQNIA